MADVSIKYKGTEIAAMNASGTKTLTTSGTYVEGDISVVYTDPEKPTQTKTVTPTTSDQTVSPDSGKVLSGVTVKAVTAAIDSNIKAENIAKDVTILGVKGTHEGGGGGGDYNVLRSGAESEATASLGKKGDIFLVTG